MNKCTKFHRATFSTLGDMPGTLTTASPAARPAKSPAVNLSKTFAAAARRAETGDSSLVVLVVITRRTANVAHCNPVIVVGKVNLRSIRLENYRF
jgi:hypothetical protein